MIDPLPLPTSDEMPAFRAWGLLPWWWLQGTRNAILKSGELTPFRVNLHPRTAVVETGRESGQEIPLHPSWWWIVARHRLFLELVCRLPAPLSRNPGQVSGSACELLIIDLYPTLTRHHLVLLPILFFLIPFAFILSALGFRHKIKHQCLFSAPGSVP